MIFENPFALWAIPLIAVPIAIHLFGRRQKNPIRISSLMWLKKLETAKRRRFKLKDYLTLLFRVLTIILVILSLATPTVEKKSTRSIIIDNHPAKWSERQIWTNPLINHLDDNILFDVQSRGGNKLGHFTKQELPGLVSNLRSSIAPLPSDSNAILLSYGFDQFKVAYKHVVLPERRTWLNRNWGLITKGSFNTFYTADSSRANWSLRNDKEILSTHEGSSFTLKHDKSIYPSTVHFQGDSIEEDNIFRFEETATESWLWVLADGATYPKDQALLKPDTILNYVDYVGTSNLRRYSGIVFQGFDFLPEFSDSTEVIMQFYPEGAHSSEETTIQPVLEASFYAEYFLGASFNQRWLTAGEQIVEIDSLEQVLLTLNNGAVGGMTTRSGVQFYIQGFSLGMAQHPFYSALGQWAEDQLDKPSISNSYLGSDHYLENVQMEHTYLDLVSFEGANSGTNSGFWLNWSKIALALALFSALLALIFAKI